jgi:hypothetical protein
MSPTSYRTAPPRTLILTTPAHRVKPCRAAVASACTRIRILPKTARRVEEASDRVRRP